MPQGFFSKKETQSISAVGGTIHSCAACGLYKDCMNPKIKPYGKFEKEIMVIGEGPGQVEDERGKPWQGKAGSLLNQALKKAGIDLFRDCVSLNAVNCRPPKNRAPNPQEIDHCRSVIVWEALEKYMPKVIIAVGGSALQSLAGHRWSGGLPITKFRGYQIPDQDLKAWLCPIYHPSYLQRLGKPAEMMQVWLDDMNAAVAKVDEPFPRHPLPEVEIVNDLRFLDDLPPRLSAFDYETTGIKPHDKGHRIVTASIAVSEDKAWAFKMPATPQGRLPFRKWLANRNVPKMAHNMKYEDHWSREILKVPVRGWEWDSMLAAHVLDNRPGVTGLKFQSYVNFGIIGYDIEVEQYLKSTGAEDGDNAKNNIIEMLKSSSGTQRLLKYNGLDSALEYKLAMHQMEQLNYDFLPF